MIMYAGYADILQVDIDIGGAGEGKRKRSTKVIGYGDVDQDLIVDYV